MELLWDYLFTGNLASITSPALSQDFKHLKIIMTGRSTRPAIFASRCDVRFNGDAGINYDWTVAFFSGATGYSSLVAQTAGALCTLTAAATPANSFAVNEILIPDYSRTDKNKGWVSPTFNHGLGTVGNMYIYYWGGMWRSTAAISTITFLDGIAPEQIITGSHISIFGLK